jgi:hypothetical protein
VKHLHGNVCTFFRDGICSLQICVVQMESFSTVLNFFLKVMKMLCNPDHNVIFVNLIPICHGKKI